MLYKIRHRTNIKKFPTIRNTINRIAYLSCFLSKGLARIKNTKCKPTFCHILIYKYPVNARFSIKLF